ncbi:MAG: ABC transporter permease [Planctomycetes bacterium]|nr:ABC transporter permease [Planctomycetota bacterium]
MSPTVRALFLDAYYQVLDNKVFRILVVLVIVLVLPTFVFGAREEGFVILFGMKTVPWENLAWLVGHNSNPDLIVEKFQELVVGGLAGTIGILFSIAATAFFVPRMLEKGAADVVFSRPVGRVALLFARYCAGVLFVAILAATLVVGMHVGLLLVSGRSDPAFLWTILTIVYIFALVHAVSVLVGVITRNSVAALLVTMLFFTLNGCVHNIWILSDYAREQGDLARNDQDPDAVHEDKVPPILYHSLDALHFTLPKTTDADLIVRKLRRVITERPALLEDGVTGTSVLESPEGFELEGATGKRDLEHEPARWKASAGDSGASLVLRREARLLDGKRRSKYTAAKALAAQVTKSGATIVASPDFEPGPGLHPEMVCWTESTGGSAPSCATGFLSLGDWMLVLEVRARENAGRELQSLVQRMRLDENDPRGMDPARWYERKLSWTGPLRHNIFFSIGSSLVFALLLFLLAAWRLKRIDF